MKVIIRRISPTGRDEGSDELEAPLIYYAADGDGALYYHLHDAGDKRVGGGVYAPGHWSRADESAQVEPGLAELWRKRQKAVSKDPDLIP